MFKKLFLIFLILFVFLLNSSFVLSKNSYLLVINEYKSNKNLINLNVKEGENFLITYTHSVALTPIYEFYKIENGKIILYEFHFYDQCAGLPTEPTNKEILVLDNGVFKLKNMERVFENLIYGVYEKGNCKLIYKDKIINLSELFGNKFLKIEIRRN